MSEFSVPYSSLNNTIEQVSCKHLGLMGILCIVKFITLVSQGKRWVAGVKVNNREPFKLIKLSDKSGFASITFGTIVWKGKKYSKKVVYSAALRECVRKFELYLEYEIVLTNVSCQLVMCAI